MNNIGIRAYEPGDFAALCRIHDPARQKELALAGLSEAFLPLQIAAEREDLFGYSLYVAEYDGAVSGFVAFTQEELAWLYVDVALTRRGIGRALMAFALEHMDEDVTIEVLVGNQPAISLYESFGFQISQTISGVMPGNEEFPVSVHVMKCSA